MELNYDSKDIIDEVKDSLPLVDSLHLGHTPVQVKFFKTQQQRGSRKFEFWQHLVQMKSLISGIQDSRLDLEDLEADLEVLDSFFSRLTKPKAKRLVEKKRLVRRWEALQDFLADKELELKRHHDFVVAEYQDLTACSEDQLLEGEEEYWVQRLSRQLAFGKMAIEQGVSAGDLAAIGALPQDLGKSILQETHKLLTSGEIWGKKQIGAK